MPRSTVYVGTVTASGVKVSRVGSVRTKKGAALGPPVSLADPHEITVLPSLNWWCCAFCACGWAGEPMDREDAEWSGRRHQHEARRGVS